MTRPRRLMTRHFSQIGFTDGLTFICLLLSNHKDSSVGY